MKQILIQKGEAVVAEVSAPTAGFGEVLVQVSASCLSIGTEMTGVRASAVPMWKRALNQPEKVKTVLNLARDEGVKRAWRTVADKRDSAEPTGYSSAGVVVEVGAGVDDLMVGDRVACAGSPHAELICVPRNLCVPMPENLDWEAASTVTLGAIALQGVRRAQPTLGECFVVLGLGVLGQLTLQFLRMNGCRVIGIDLDRDRIRLAKELGLDIGLHPDDGDESEQIARLTDGLGADGVIITAATPSDALVSSAFQFCRKKGRVVLVGDVGLNLNRADFYAKEIDFLISTSYGPGRYDNRYEEQGLDYPVPYIRWTENRNMAEYLRLLGEKRVTIVPMVSATYPVDETPVAYASLKDSAKKPLMVLLTYPTDVPYVPTARIKHRVVSTKKKAGKVRVAVIGAGGFAKSSHLPNMQDLSNRFELQAVVNRTGHSSAAVAKQFGAAYSSTDYKEVLSDSDVDAVIIATRHHLHGSMALEALEAGKHVLVEKPLALLSSEVDAIDTFFNGSKETSPPILLTGYNRRFSPYASRMIKMLKDRSGPFMLNYRMNAGHIPMDHWVHSNEGGGRNLGEACHLYDLFVCLAGQEATKISAHSISPASNYYARNDNFVTTLSFADGSVATLTYTALGNRTYPKETADLYWDGKIATLNDYRELDVFGMKEKGASLSTRVQTKGLKEELLAFSDAIKTGEMPISWWQQKEVARIGFAVEEQIMHLGIQ